MTQPLYCIVLMWTDGDIGFINVDSDQKLENVLNEITNLGEHIILQRWWVATINGQTLFDTSKISDFKGQISTQNFNVRKVVEMIRNNAASN